MAFQLHRPVLPVAVSVVQLSLPKEAHEALLLMGRDIRPFAQQLVSRSVIWVGDMHLSTSVLRHHLINRACMAADT